MIIIIVINDEKAMLTIKFYDTTNYCDRDLNYPYS